VVGQRPELENAIRRMVVLTDGEQAFQASLGRVATGLPPRPRRPHPPSPRACGRSRAAPRAAAERTALAEVLGPRALESGGGGADLKVSYKTLLNKNLRCELFHRRVGTFRI